MNRLQSIISAIATYCVAVVAPSIEICVKQGWQAGLTAFISGTIAFAWAVWKNHNFTEAANEAQAHLEEIKADEGEDVGEALDDYVEGDEDEDDEIEEEEEGEE